MSRWLQSVNTLLEQLDGKVDQIASTTDDNADHEHGVQTVQDILAKRGLGAEELDKEAAAGSIDEELDANNESDVNKEIASKELDDEVLGLKEEANDSAGQGELEGVPVEDAECPITVDTSQEETNSEEKALTIESEDELAQSASEKEQNPGTTAVIDSQEENEVGDKQMDEEINETRNNTTDSLDGIQSAANRRSSENPQLTEHVEVPRDLELERKYKELQQKFQATLAESKEGQKEARTLGRHVVALNSQLEVAEAEIGAQRTELERAADRMERDRARHKQEKETQVERHAAELKALKQQHETAMSEQKTRSNAQLEESRKRLREVEERRMQEGGDWTKELEEAIQREQGTMQRVVLMEDENSTLLSQVSTLQSQLTSLESRMESARQTADSATEREREAEDRLDSALSLHARQLSQRQAREAELERTVADLSATLVVARNRELNRLKSEGATIDGGHGQDGESSLKGKLETLQDEMETVNAQLEMERQRAETLHKELNDVSQERTEEASAAHARQLQHERQIADLSLTVSKLQSSIRDSRRDSFRETNGGASDHEDKQSQIESLSEQVLRQQEKIGNYASEVSALRSRLRSALNRADSAEQALVASGSTGDPLDIMERAPSSGNRGVSRTMRRRGGNKPQSIRAAMSLQPGQTEGKEKIGKAIDALDSFSVETGKYLRYNPLARGAFILYLIVLHIWVTIILFFHAHNFEPGHVGTEDQHGPHALLHASEKLARSP